MNHVTRRILFRWLLPAFCTGLAVAGAEIAARVIDGYALSSVRLDKLPDRLVLALDADRAVGL